MAFYRLGMIAVLSLCGGLSTGCSFSRLATTKLAAALTNDNSTVFSGEDDVELVRDALPFTMKLHETLLLRDTGNVQLLLATGRLFALYAQAFVLAPVDTFTSDRAGESKNSRMRAKRLFLRSRDYTLRAISIEHPGAVPPGKPVVDSVLTLAGRADTALLYWCATAWLGAIATDRSDLALAMSVKRPIAMLQKLCALDSGYGLGAAHELLSVCAAVTPTAVGGGEKAARFHFDQACARSAGKKVSPYLSFVSSWCIKKGERDEFIRLLQRALDVDPNGEPSLRLQNTINRRRAQWYLDHADRFFPIIAPPDTATGSPVMTAPHVAQPAAIEGDTLKSGKKEPTVRESKK